MEADDDVSKLDKAVSEVMSRKLTGSELQGFVSAKKNKPSTMAFVDVGIRSRREKKGVYVVLGVKGEF